MKKKMTLEEAKKMDIQSIIVGVFVLLSALAAVLGFGMLSIGILMVLAFCYVMAGMGKDLKELCDGLVEECESRYGK